MSGIRGAIVNALESRREPESCRLNSDPKPGVVIRQFDDALSLKWLTTEEIASQFKHFKRARVHGGLRPPGETGDTYLEPKFWHWLGEEGGLR